MREIITIKNFLIIAGLLLTLQATAQVTINTYTIWGAPGGTSEFNPNGDLTINDTLIIYGNLKLDNKENLIIKSGAVVIIIGDFFAVNKVEINLGGYFIVTGEFNKSGSDNQGEITDSGGSMFLFDDDPGWSGLEHPRDYGDENDIIDDPIFDFFEDLIEDICDLSITGAVITPDNCDGSPYDGAINITVSGSAGVINYRWRDDEGNIISNVEDISGLEAGDYYITVYQGFCFDSDTFTISSSLGTAGPITGSQQVCMNSTAVYSITPVPGATSYVWTANNGVTGTSTTNSIVLTFPNSGNVTISVHPVNDCGTGLPSSLEITVNPLPVPTISGPNTCAGIPVNYQTENGMSDYIWTITPGSGTISNPYNIYNPLVTWGNVTGQYEDRIISVNYTDANGCKAITPASMSVRVFKIPQTGPTYRLPNE